jgi:hypothetical protein
MTHPAQLTSAVSAVAFATAGNATLTLVSLKTGNRFTYSIRANDDSTAYFVGLLTGPDNREDYKYMGRIARGIYWHGRKVPRAGDIGREAPSALAFDYVWRALARGEMPAQCEIWHEGKCGRCGRKLTVPESIASGFGPECIGKL